MFDYQPQRYAQEGGMATGHTALLSPSASYVDLEPVQWRRLYDWLLSPNQTHEDLFILHNQGQILTVNPVYAKKKLDIPDQIKSPRQLAQYLHSQWQRGTVVILERSHYQEWLDDIQSDIWIPGDDILAYGLKLKDRTSKYLSDEGIALYPSPLEAWQHTPPDLLSRLGSALAPDEQQRSVALVVFDGTVIWTSLILCVQNRQIQLVTTLPAEVLTFASGNWRENYSRLIPRIEDVAGPVRLGLFCERQSFEKLGITPVYWPDWIEAQNRGDVISIPSSLDTFVASI